MPAASLVEPAALVVGHGVLPPCLGGAHDRASRTVMSAIDYHGCYCQARRGRSRLRTPRGQAPGSCEAGEGTQRRVERLVGAWSSAYASCHDGSGSITTTTRTQRPTAVGTSGKTARRDASQQRRAERGAFLRLGQARAACRRRRRRSRSHQWLARRRPTPGPRTPRRPAPDASSESRRPNATPSSTERTSAPRGRAAAGADERAARVRVGMRRPLAGEVGREEEPLGARRHASASPTSPSTETSGARRSEPLQGARRREHHAHRLPGAGDGVAEGVDCGPGRARTGSAARTTPEVPSTTQTRRGGRSRRRSPRRAGRPHRRRRRPSAPSRTAPFAEPGRRLEHGREPGRRAARARPSTSSLHARLTTSRRSVPEASEASIAHSPVRRSRT